MPLIRVSLIPVEFFEVSIREKFEHSLKQDAQFKSSGEGSFQITFKELCDFSPSVLKAQGNGENTLVTFHGSSACFVKITEYKNWTPTLESVLAELKTRGNLHREYISSKTLLGVPLHDILAQEIATKTYEIVPHYVFSYYIYRPQSEPTLGDINYLKLLAEPSLVDLDDMLSAKNYDESAVVDFPADKVSSILRSMTDCDIAPDVSTYVTWASILCIDKSTDNRCSKTFDILLALETRLQMVWNRCYSFSNLGDAVLAQNTKLKIDVGKFYWELARTFDDAQGILAATSSSRANKMFEVMLQTSALEREIARLQGKVNLLDRYIAWRNEQKDSRYRKMVEILLFFAALSQLVPIFFALPIIHNEIAGYATISLLLVAGLLAILLRKA